MNNTKTIDRSTVRLAFIFVLAFLAFVLLVILLIKALFSIFLPGVWRVFRRGDKAALSMFITEQSRFKGAFVLWVLCFVQVLLIFVPLIPIQIVSGMTYGFFRGSLISFSRSLLANLTVYCVATKTSKYINEIADAFPRIGKWLNMLQGSNHRVVYTMMAFLTPGFPNGAIPYRAAHAGIDRKTFLTAALMALPIPTILTCLAGHLAMSGNVLFSTISVLALIALTMILFHNKERVVAELARLPFMKQLED